MPHQTKGDAPIYDPTFGRDEVLCMFDRNRGGGNTTAVMRGAVHTPNTVVLTVNIEQASRLRRQYGVSACSLHMFLQQYQGQDPVPVVYDGTLVRHIVERVPPLFDNAVFNRLLRAHRC